MSRKWLGENSNGLFPCPAALWVMTDHKIKCRQKKHKTGMNKEKPSNDETEQNIKFLLKVKSNDIY